ncbi:TetR/AcrR family transcriptional regulator [Corynebacterium uterequi]|uniref:Transcriptional regulator, TetR family n=1 Tax=Corynebacterium uterequi TaxID=1072256 RepID=A0A0G3HDL3_9CORY|nr:TetR/AcrR family transcriptional regulator [Corynebacterium uterequi]AKK10790.1 transcriptional regulator, TetR family [Corynebacterium uterequi]
MVDNSGGESPKRARTRRALIDSATRLVAERTFAEVTVDDICADAGVSRRTFFNHMDSKDEAILGTLPLRLDDGRVAELVENASDNLPVAMLDALAGVIADQCRHDAAEDPDFLPRVRARRATILHREPSLALIFYQRFRELGAFLRGVAVEHFDAHPGDRRCLELAVEDEAVVVVALVREAILVAAARPATHAAAPTELAAAWRESVQHLSTLAKGLSW